MATVDGYGVSLTVRHGALVLSDGLGLDRRERVLRRSERTVRRIVVLSTAGTITMAALRWCADVGIAVITIDPHGPRVLSVGAPTSHDDARLLRAQALAPLTDVGLDIARTLLAAKLDGQHNVVRDHFGDAQALGIIAAARSELSNTDSVGRALLVEANAASAYFHAWAGLPVMFAKNHEPLVPPTWLRFTQRTSTLAGRNSPRSASDPVNAVLNYCYTLAAIEATIACHAMGLHPGLGVLHADRPNRDSLSMDLLEPVRAVVDEFVLHLFKSHVFSRSDFGETRDGRCRVLPPLAAVLTAQMPLWAEAVSPFAEQVAHTIGDSGGGAIKHRRPLTGKAALRKTPTPRIVAPQRCPDCGDTLADRRRLRCPGCGKASAAPMARQRLVLARARLESLESTEPRPSGAAMRAARASLNRAEATVWELEHPEHVADPDHFRNHILPGLQPLPIAAIGEAISVGTDASWRIREGTLTPHRRHWDALLALTSTSSRSHDPRAR